MKKMRMWLFAAAAIAAMVAMTGCPNGGGGGTVDPVPLPPASTSLDGSHLMWLPVSNAIGHYVYAEGYLDDGTEFPAQVIGTGRGDIIPGSLFFDLATFAFEDGDYYIWVVAVGDGIRWLDSSSHPVLFSVGLPRLITPSGETDPVTGIVTWSPIAGAASFRVYVGGNYAITVMVAGQTEFSLDLRTLTGISYGFLPVTIVAIPANAEDNRPSFAGNAGVFVNENPLYIHRVIPAGTIGALPGISGAGGGVFELVTLPNGSGGEEFVRLSRLQRGASHYAVDIWFAQLAEMGLLSLPGTYELRATGRGGLGSTGMVHILGYGNPAHSSGEGYAQDSLVIGEQFSLTRTFVLPDEIRQDDTTRGWADLPSEVFNNWPPNTWSRGRIQANAATADYFIESATVHRADGTQVWCMGETLMLLILEATSVNITPPAAGTDVLQGFTLDFDAEVMGDTGVFQGLGWSVWATPPAVGTAGTPATGASMLHQTPGLTDSGATLTVAADAVPGTVTVRATVPGTAVAVGGVPSNLGVFADITVNILAAAGLTVGAPSGTLMADVEGEVRVFVVGGSLGEARIVNFADANVVTGLPSTIAPSGTFTIDAGGTGSGYLYLRGTAAEADVGTPTITVTIGTDYDTFVLEILAFVPHRYYRLPGSPANLDAVRSANEGRIAFDMQAFADAEAALAHFGQGVGVNRGTVTVYERADGTLSAVVSDFTGGGASDPWNTGWSPIRLIAANQAGIHLGYTVHIRGRFGPGTDYDGFVPFTNIGNQHLRYGFTGTGAAITGPSLPLAPGPFELTFELEHLTGLTIVWNAWGGPMETHPFNNTINAGTNPFTIGIDDLVVVRPAAVEGISVQEPSGTFFQGTAGTVTVEVVGGDLSPNLNVLFADAGVVTGALPPGITITEGTFTTDAAGEGRGIITFSGTATEDGTFPLTVNIDGESDTFDLVVLASVWPGSPAPAPEPTAAGATAVFTMTADTAVPYLTTAGGVTGRIGASFYMVGRTDDWNGIELRPQAADLQAGDEVVVLGRFAVNAPAGGNVRIATDLGGTRPDGVPQWPNLLSGGGVTPGGSFEMRLPLDDSATHTFLLTGGNFPLRINTTNTVSFIIDHIVVFRAD